MQSNEVERKILKVEMTNIIEEASVVLPGIQALFGFQTIAVFGERFEQLPASGTWSHLVSLALIAFSIALIMTLAAHHRLANFVRHSKQQCPDGSVIE
jgi:hypothetical protein